MMNQILVGGLPSNLAQGLKVRPDATPRRGGFLGGRQEGEGWAAGKGGRLEGTCTRIQKQRALRIIFGAQLMEPIYQLGFRTQPSW